MAWYPGKYAKKATSAAKTAAKEAVEVTKTAINEGPAAARKRADESFAAAYAEAERTWEEAKNEALDALEQGSNLLAFQDRAQEWAKKNEKLIMLGRDTALALSLDAYTDLSHKILEPNRISNEDQAASLTKNVYGPPQEANQRNASLKEAGQKEALATCSVSLNNASGGIGIGVDTSGVANPFPIIKHDFNRWLPIPYREAAVAMGGIVCLSAGASFGMTKGPANEQWGNFIKMTWAGDLEGPGAHISVGFSLETGEIEGFDVGVDMSYGSPINIFSSIGRTMRLPILYYTSYYD